MTSATSEEKRLQPAAWHPLLLAVICLIWGLLLAKAGKEGVFRVVGPFSILVTITALWFGVRLGTGLRHSPVLSVALGLGSGAAMALLTFPLYRAASFFFAALPDQVSALYLLTRGASHLETFLWTISILTAEEYLWRGAFFESLRHRMGDLPAAATSVIVYSLVQFGTGSALVPLIALVCGAVWMALRWWSGSIMVPLLSHAVWTIVVLLYYPVT
jgi:membrane protease YdiL (CAAX protease family)